jgi:hypothetical protein
MSGGGGGSSARSQLGRVGQGRLPNDSPSAPLEFSMVKEKERAGLPPYVA